MAKDNQKPLISIIMSVYNEEKYISAAILSILNQTEKDFELIIFDDNSTDGTIEIVKNIKDSRIYLIKNVKNMGLTSNLNRGLHLAKGKYIARMDGDDISLPRRLELQRDYLEKNKDVMLVSCQTCTIGKENLVSKIEKDNEKLKIMMLLRPVLAHPGFMMKRQLIDEGFFYDENFSSAQDYDFAVRITRNNRHQIGLVYPVLLLYRTHDMQVSVLKTSKQFQNAERVRTRLREEVGVDFTDEQMGIFQKWVKEEKTDDINVYIEAGKLIKEIEKANRNTMIYDDKNLHQTLMEMLIVWIIRSKSIRNWWQLLFLEKSIDQRIFWKTFFLTGATKVNAYFTRKKLTGIKKQ